MSFIINSQHIKTKPIVIIKKTFMKRTCPYFYQQNDIIPRHAAH